MAEVLMTTLLCRWCGAPYSVPSVMYETSPRSLLCPSGHSYIESRSIQERLDRLREDLAKACDRNAKLVRINTSLRGVITRMKKVAQ